MDILHVTAAYAPFTQGGGVERYIHHLAVQHQALGHRVSVAARRCEAPGGAFSYRSFRADTLALLRHICIADVVHLHGPRAPYSALAAAFCLLTRTPFVYTAHCFYDGRGLIRRFGKLLWDRLIERLLFHCAYRVILLSDLWRRDAAKRRLPLRNIAILPNGIEVDALTRESPATITLSGAPVLLSVSRLDPVKRIEDSIAALAMPSLTTAHLHIVGSGADEARLRRIAAQHEVADRVIFHGFKPDADIAAMARAADVFVLASAEEGMPTTVLEMLARRLPVAASAIPGNLALLQALDWPHHYPVGDVAALAVVLLAARNRPVPDQLIDALRRLFDWPKIAAGMLAHYPPCP